MLAEFLADRGDWTLVMPGARACLFSLDKWSFPLPLQLERLHFETLFCMRGSVTLTRQDGSFLTAGAQQVLILTDLTDLAGASVDAPWKAFWWQWMPGAREKAWKVSASCWVV